MATAQYTEVSRIYRFEGSPMEESSAQLHLSLRRLEEQYGRLMKCLQTADKERNEQYSHISKLQSEIDDLSKKLKSNDQRLHLQMEQLMTADEKIAELVLENATLSNQMKCNDQMLRLQMEHLNTADKKIAGLLVENATHSDQVKCQEKSMEGLGFRCSSLVDKQERMRTDLEHLMEDRASVCSLQSEWQEFESQMEQRDSILFQDQNRRISALEDEVNFQREEALRAAQEDQRAHYNQPSQNDRPAQKNQLARNLLSWAEELDLLQSSEVEDQQEGERTECEGPAVKIQDKSWWHDFAHRLLMATMLAGFPWVLSF